MPIIMMCGFDADFNYSSVLNIDNQRSSSEANQQSTSSVSIQILHEMPHQEPNERGEFFIKKALSRKTILHTKII